MGLAITNNVTSLTAQNNLSKTSSALAKSLERLSSGLKVNRGADGPAALVISEQQRAQIAGLQAAIDNTSKAVSLVQTGEGALTEINSLLDKIRSLAIDSANSGVNDANALAANQAEVSNALDTIDRIASNTQFGTKKLLDGSAGFTGSTDDPDVAFLKATSDSIAGTYAVNITTAAEKAFIEAGTPQGAALAADETLILNGVQITLKSGQTQTQVIDRINEYSGQTGVKADNGGAGGATRLVSINYGSAAKITVQSNVVAAANSSGFGTSALTGVDVIGTIGGQTATGVGNILTGSTGVAKGISIALGLTGGSATTAVIGAQGNVTVQDASLVFQVGPNAGQTVKIAIDKIKADAMGIGVTGVQFGNLRAIDVRTTSGAQDAIRVIDQAITDVTTLRGRMGAFQQPTLESNANNLRTTLENTVAAESVIRDTDFAQETANFTKNQILLQAGATVLSNANQTSQLVLNLLRGGG